MRRRFVTLDVFTDKRFAGNPLAVVLEPDGLDTAAMQTIAREFNLSETVFVFPPADKANRAKLRIFTPAARTCRSPAIRRSARRCCSGASTAAAARATSCWRKTIGLVPCRVEAGRRGQRPRAFRHLRACRKRRRAAGRRRRSRRRWHLRPATSASTDLRPARWSAGNRFTFVPVRGLDAIGALPPDLAHFEKAFGGGDRGGLSSSARETAEAGHHFHARMFAPGHGRAGRPGDRLGGGGVCRLSGGARRLRGRRARDRGSSRATRWAGRA